MDQDSRDQMDISKLVRIKSYINETDDILVLIPKGEEFPKSIGFKSEQDGEMFAKYMKTKHGSEPVPLKTFQMECFDWSVVNNKWVYIIFREPSADAVPDPFYHWGDNLIEQ